MAKTYTPINWQNGEEGNTPVTAENLNHMDNAIKDLYDEGTTSKDIVIGSETEVTDDTKLFIDTGEVENLGSEISSGSNDNGNYIKFADGTMVCYGKILIEFNNQSVTPAKEFNFPTSFIDNNVIVNLTSIGGDNAYMFIFTTISYSSKFSVIARNYSNNTITKGREVGYIAIGRWK